MGCGLDQRGVGCGYQNKKQNKTKQSAKQNSPRTQDSGGRRSRGGPRGLGGGEQRGGLSSAAPLALCVRPVLCGFRRCHPRRRSLVRRVCDPSESKRVARLPRAPRSARGPSPLLSVSRPGGGCRSWGVRPRRPQPQRPSSQPHSRQHHGIQPTYLRSPKPRARQPKHGDRRRSNDARAEHARRAPARVTRRARRRGAWSHHRSQPAPGAIGPSRATRVRPAPRAAFNRSDRDHE